MIFEKDRLAMHRFMVRYELSHKDLLTLVTIAQEGEKGEKGSILYSGDRKSVTNEMGQGETSINYSIKKLEQIGAFKQLGSNRDRKIKIPIKWVQKLKSFCKL